MYDYVILSETKDLVLNMRYFTMLNMTRIKLKI